MIPRDSADVRAIARHACRGVIDGSVSLRTGDQVRIELEREGWWELASHVRLACQTRRAATQPRTRPSVWASILTTCELFLTTAQRAIALGAA